jgi:hypothetical protein
MRSLIVILGLILLALPAFAADNTTHGQQCDSDITLIEGGVHRTHSCVNLCNNYAVTDSGDSEDACTEYEFNGVPDIIILEREENNTDCTNDPTFTFTTGPITGGDPDYPLDTTAVVLNDAVERLIFLQDKGPMNSFLFTAVSDDAGCSDVDVRMYLINEK